MLTKISLSKVNSKTLFIWSWLLALVVLDTLVMINVGSMADTARDVYFSWQIRTGEEYPTQGPELSGVVHVGPAWFYVVSLPLFFDANWLGVALWVGFLSALRFPLAYATGRRLVNARFGLMVAALLALPGWTAINYLVFSHTNVIQLTVLSSIYCLARLREKYQARWYMALGLSLSLGLHAHPATYAVAALVMLVLSADLVKHRAGAGGILLIALFALIPFLPYIYTQQQSGWPDWSSSVGLVQSTAYGANFLNAYEVFLGTLIDGTQVAYRNFLSALNSVSETNAGRVAWLQIIFVSVGLLASLRLIVSAETRRMTAVLYMSLLLVILLISLVRDHTAYYMSYPIYPFIYAALAWGVEGGPPRLRKTVLAALFFAAPVSLLAFQQATSNLARLGTAPLSGNAMVNIKEGDYRDRYPVLHYPAVARVQLAKWICSFPGEITLHGDLALIVEHSYGMEYRIRCSGPTVHLGGRRPGEHRLGISSALAEGLNLGSDNMIGPVILLRHMHVQHPTEPVALSRGDVYPPRTFLQAAPVSRSVSFTSSSDQFLSITNLYDYLMPYQVTVIANNLEHEALAANRSSSIYRCYDCTEGSVKWQVTITAPNPNFVELVTFSTDAGN